MPPACATLHAWSFSLRAGRYDMTLTKHVHGGFGRCSGNPCTLWLDSSCRRSEPSARFRLVDLKTKTTAALGELRSQGNIENGYDRGLLALK